MQHYCDNCFQPIHRPPADHPDTCNTCYAKYDIWLYPEETPND